VGGWLDRWAICAASGTSPSPAAPAEAPATAESTHSRRDFMKKATVVGGAAWSVPVIQIVTAPAVAASPTVCSGGVLSGAAPCGTPNGSYDAPAQSAACQAGWYCKPGPIFGYMACRSTTP